MKILDLCEADRPRERMMSSGASSLSNSELLAVILRTGVPGKSALEISQSLFKDCNGSLVALFGMSMKQLCGCEAIGPGKASAIQAVAELGRRFMGESSMVRKTPVLTARSAYEYLLPKFKGLDHEECWVMFLNSSSYVTGMAMVSTGGLVSTTVDARGVVRLALDNDASAIILAHNHPGLDPRPSHSDIKSTENIKNAANACGIELFDHIVVCDDSFYSFADERSYLA